ncbi:MAG: Asp23/Gls24 family envelope stress response protein [Clostridia bacterium]|nr:Asp23/Gls24 family envelope stress response protein [Clostridia bacterium]
MDEKFDAQTSGNIKISEEVIAIIAGISTQEVDGVAYMGSGGVAWTELLSKKSGSKGVKVELSEDSVKIDIHITVKFGVKIQDVCSSVQNHVATSVETMAGLKEITVNVFVDGVDVPAKTESELSDE